MYEVIVLDLSSGKKFRQKFNSEYLFNKFKNKCKYSKKVKIIAEFKN